MTDKRVRLCQQLEQVVLRFERANRFQPHDRRLFRIEEMVRFLASLYQRTHRHCANGDNGILRGNGVQVELLIAGIEQGRQASGASADVLVAELLVKETASFLLPGQLTG